MDLFDYMRENTQEQDHFLRTSGNGKDDSCKGDRTYDQCGVQADQCYSSRKKRYGAGGK